jgi:glycine cleavage system aminomethyltransferase T/glycine/D-amino acid oxidase-like deaminating enzyme
MNTFKEPRSHAQIVIVGGGIIGTSIAYHLSKLGCKDVALLERDKLTSGTTWHAAGLIASGGLSNETALWVQRYSRDLYMRLEAETGYASGFRQTGYLQVASTRLRQQMLRREQHFANSQGLEKFEISPGEIRSYFPHLEVSDLVSAMYTPVDGIANPVDITMALAAGARNGGVTLIEQLSADGLIVKDGRVRGVVTKYGHIEAETVVLAAGMWTRQLAATIGVSIPLQAAEHYYLLTDSVDGIGPELPVVEDPDNYSYMRPEGKGLLLGLFEPNGACWELSGIPQDASFLELPPDWERIAPYIDQASKRLPILNSTGIKKLFCGPESFTPDGSCLVGEVPECSGLYVAAGLNSLGVLSGGGIGSLVAEWIVRGVPSHDVTAINVARSMPHESTRTFLGARIPTMLSYVFSNSHVPEFSHASAREIRRSPLHERFVQRAAHFAVSSGWEIPKWFSQNGEMHSVIHQFERQHSFIDNKIEHVAVRSAVGITDKTFMGKFLVEGPDAERVLNRVGANTVSVAVGRNIYTQWLNDQGGIVSDLTITRLAEQRFLLVTPDSLQRSTPSWIRRHTLEKETCVVVDVTSAYSILAIQGPQSRELLQAISGADLSTERVPFRSSCQIEVGPLRVLAIRITYVGELGYELYIPSEYAVAVYDSLVKFAADSRHSLTHFGLTTLNNLRLEKGYRDFGADIDNSDTPLEAGLGFVVDFKKAEFVGREALLRQRDLGVLTRKLVQVLLREPDAMLFGGEPVMLDHKVVGYMRSAGYGHHLGAAVGLALVEHAAGVSEDLLQSSRITVGLIDHPVEAVASLAPLYDPKSARVRI